MVFLTFGPQPSEPLFRVFLYAFNHHHQVTPFHGIAV